MLISYCNYPATKLIDSVVLPAVEHKIVKVKSRIPLLCLAAGFRVYSMRLTGG